MGPPIAYSAGLFEINADWTKHKKLPAAGHAEPLKFIVQGLAGRTLIAGDIVL